MVESEPPPPAPGDFILEKDVRLSASFLWSLQHTYYQAQGLNAWASNTVPEYISTNPYLAQAYARVVFGFLRDCATLPSDDQPVYIIELGAGSGRFAFHFLRAISGLLEQAPPGLPGFRYIMTDFAERNVAAWRDNPVLQSWAASGKLDFARFNAAEDTGLTLVESGVSLRPGGLSRPVVVLANYVFDSLPQDAFAIRGGELFEGLLTITSTQAEPDLQDPALLERITTNFRDIPAGQRPYRDQLLDGLLFSYAQSLPDTRLTFPVTALRCLLRLADLSGGKLLAVAGDKGYALPGDLIRKEYPGLVVYGAFSMTVNLHAIGQLALALGGRYLHVQRDSTLFNVCAFLFGQHPAAWVETALAYREAIHTAGPDDFYALRRVFLRNPDLLNLEQVLAYLRLSAWDPWLFELSYAAFLSGLSGATSRMLDDAAAALENIWQNFFAPYEDEDVAYDIGILFETIGRHAQAVPCLLHSLEKAGPHPATYTHLATCYAGLGRRADALSCLHQAIGLDPTWEPARALFDKLS